MAYGIWDMGYVGLHPRRHQAQCDNRSVVDALADYGGALALEKTYHGNTRLSR